LYLSWVVGKIGLDTALYLRTGKTLKLAWCRAGEITVKIQHPVMYVSHSTMNHHHQPTS
jgi:hypothetical protein